MTCPLSTRMRSLWVASDINKANTHLSKKRNELAYLLLRPRIEWASGLTRSRNLKKSSGLPSIALVDLICSWKLFSFRQWQPRHQKRWGPSLTVLNLKEMESVSCSESTYKIPGKDSDWSDMGHMPIPGLILIGRKIG